MRGLMLDEPPLVGGANRSNGNHEGDSDGEGAIGDVTDDFRPDSQPLIDGSFQRPDTNERGSGLGARILPSAHGGVERVTSRGEPLNSRGLLVQLIDDDDDGRDGGEGGTQHALSLISREGTPTGDEEDAFRREDAVRRASFNFDGVGADLTTRNGGYASLVR